MAERLSARARQWVAIVAMRVPEFRGKGRVLLAVDGILTDLADPASYLVTGRLNNCARYHFDLRSWGEKFAFYKGRLEAEYIDVLRGLYRGGTFIDIGSSRGLYLVSLGRGIVERGGRILSFEPVPENLDRQRTNLALNGLESSVECFPVALGRVEGVLSFYSDPTGADGNAFVVPNGGRIVRVRPLDSVLREVLPDPHPVSMMKMDVEGFEPEVLRGAEATIRADRPIILAEFCRERMSLNGFTMEDSWRFLAECGYSSFVLSGRKLVAVAEPREWENLFFLPTGCGIPGSSRTE